MYRYLSTDTAIRFSYKNDIIPDMEFKFEKTNIDRKSLDEKQKVSVREKNIFVSPIPMQIAFKRYVLGSDKDLEDAEHLEKVFNIEEHEIDEYGRILR